MSDKQTVLELLNRMPDTLTLDQVRDELELLSKLREGYSDAQAGRVVPHEEVKRQYAAWLSK